jgi:hypothetical protein
MVQVRDGKVFRNKPEILFSPLNMGRLCLLLLLVELEHLV